MKTQGDEYYAKMNDKIAVYGDEKVIEFFVDLQVYGTPEQGYEKILAIHRQGNDRYVGVFSYAGMAHEEAARNMRLFAATVMPNSRSSTPVRPSTAHRCCPTCAWPPPRSKATGSLSGHRAASRKEASMRFVALGLLALQPLDIGGFDRPRPWRSRAGHGHGHGHGAAASTAHPHG